MSTADLARKIPHEDRPVLLRLALGHRAQPTPILLRKKLVNVNDGVPEITGLGTQVARHYAAGHPAWARGRMVRAFARALAAQTVDGDIARDLAPLLPEDRDRFDAVLVQMRTELRAQRYRD